MITSFLRNVILLWRCHGRICLFLSLLNAERKHGFWSFGTEVYGTFLLDWSLVKARRCMATIMEWLSLSSLYCRREL